MPRLLPRIIALACCVWLSLALISRADEDPAHQTARPAKNFKLLPGFQAELLYTVPKSTQGSWVNLAVDPKGRLITSDQLGKLFRITPPAPGNTKTPTKVEPILLNIGQAHGLLCAFGNLYVVVNGGAAEGSGLYRVSDTNGDDQYDKVELLRKINGRGEHGPHAVVLAPDGKSLLIVAGNFTTLPEITSSLVPRNWGEDFLLGRLPDARGHDPHQMAPAGWICRTDPDGKKFELIASGFRNPFDMAVSPYGDIFTYDSDMEWDIGLPWYRPTRINYVVSGAENGWRNGSGKWPEYYPDSLPPVVNVGPGSPTGMTFGTGLKFPARYQRALYGGDWSYGQLYAFHIVPAGASYTATIETFASASPLPLTDVVVNPKDGAMYFTVGGRNSDSALYRITYAGKESTFTALGDPRAVAPLRAERLKLEALHKAGAPGAVDTAWPYLGQADVYLRYAARVAVEHQPVATWQQRALAEKNPEALITAMVALARCGDKQLRPRIVEALSKIDFNALKEYDQLALARAYALAFIRMGRPEEAERAAVLAQLDSHYPAATQALNRELGLVLVYLEAPDVVGRTLKLLAAAPSQDEQIQYILVLRGLKRGWTLDQRRAYFEWFLHAGQQRGGASFEGFIANIRAEAITNLSPKLKEALKETLSKPVDREKVVDAQPPRKFVRNWTLAELVPQMTAVSSGRDYAHGAAMFGAAGCLKCHRFSGTGGITGPDLTTVGRRFSPRDVLESIVEPDKVISDQYQSTIFELKNGTTVVGRVANLKDDNLMIMTNMLDPGHFTKVRRSDIEETRVSTVSMMPAGLLSTFSREEILDLVAYLRSGGSPSDPAFAKTAPAAAAGK